MKEITSDALFTLKEFKHSVIFDGVKYPWEILSILQDYIEDNIKPCIGCEIRDDVILEGDRIEIGEGTVIEPPVYIKSPSIIGENVQIRPGAFIRGSVIVGDGSVVGHSTEVKNALLMNSVEVPHFNYIGDSILGNEAHTGAGVILSNYKISPDKSVMVKIGDEVFDTELRKFGAILGDGVQVGCNSVLNPGTIIGKNSIIYALCNVSGYIPSDMIVKHKPDYEIVKQR
jgi:NDP-sugar pyrophosphorylase family protein